MHSWQPPRLTTALVEHATTGVMSATGAMTAYLPARRRWMRVFFSSLRCFFFAMRLRRFLMTEPTGDLSSCTIDAQ